MSLKTLLNRNYLFILSIFVFSVFINRYYANLGVFPLDTFYHFDLGFRILQGEIPFTDIWMVSGVLINYIQALFFFILGINWNTYVLHASLMNGLISIATYFILKEFKLNINYCFIYSILFSVLAYTSSGTPFVDHHSAFFSLLGVYSSLLAIKKEKKIFWIILPIFFGFGFLSKQVPTSYITFCITIVALLYAFVNNKKEIIKYILAGSLIFILFTFIFGFFAGIKFENFIQQYIFYPQEIGGSRIDNLNLTIRGTVGHFKFVYLSLIPLFLINLKKINNENNYLKKKNFFYFIIILFFTLSLIFHQILTKNQTFIFFLVPLLVAFSHIAIEETKLKKKNMLFLFLIVFCILVTAKYHLRFNEGRKFHELSSVDLSKSVPATKIHAKLNGLQWISPEYKNNVEQEINLINNIKNHLKSDKRKKMVVTNYSFFSIILNEKLFSPSMVYTLDGTTYPLRNSRYSRQYKDLIIDVITKNNLEVIYIIDPLNKDSIYDYLDQSCLNESLIFEKLNSYEIKNCKDLKSKR